MVRQSRSPLEGNHLFILSSFIRRVGVWFLYVGHTPTRFCLFSAPRPPIPRTLSPHQRTFLVAIPSLSPAFVR
ncbi:hypothetical protein BCAL_3000 [Bifidobacterium callitrichos DSM 23973]|uniref:Uncharacterized protein n=1 Tax=Bifidobacterium callitrichos DSM 23973 TaxID=1437609 RepID=A0A087A9P3_9BIFI|nr:hypothetical protein BCAL_3000 [Bifidobacterium callitrichos DSM 23973]